MGGTEPDVDDRGTWSGKLDFFLSAVGFAVGLGNVWRFPYLAYRNGGASFLFPYIIMLIIAGVPLFFMELAVGQFASEGPITVWKVAPIFMGIGYAMFIISAVVCIYYNMIIAYAIYYMMVSFVNLDDDLPWEACGNDWNTMACRNTKFPRLSSVTYNESENFRLLWNDLYSEDCVRDTTLMTTYDDYNATLGTSAKYQKFLDTFMEAYPNGTATFSSLSWKVIQDFSGFSSCEKVYTTPSQEFFERYVLRQQYSEDIGDLGDISLKLILTLFLSWLLIFGCLMKGIKTSGKVVYFTATFPYVILIVLLVRGVTLEGHEEGVEFYVIPDWDKLTDATIWGDAASQIFYSLGIGFGGLLTMSSYNKFNNNCYRDALLVSVINCGTSIFAGFAIFSLLGHMAFVTNKDVADVATSGPGLAFIAYPDGISRLPSSSLWAFLFFFMILTLGLDSQFAMMETVISSVSDIFPRVLRKHKTPFTFLCCLIGFLLGIPQTTHGGIRVLTLMNDYSGSYNLMIVALSEILCLCYVYGLNNFLSDIEMMIGFKPTYYWKAMWMFITPAAVIFIIIVSAVQYETSGYGGQTFPGWAEGIGWLMVCTPIAAIIVVAIVQFCRYGYPACIKPTKSWGPALPENRVGRYSALNEGFEDDNGMALPYVVDSKTGPPPSYNGGDHGHDNPVAQKYISERL